MPTEDLSNTIDLEHNVRRRLLMIEILLLLILPGIAAALLAGSTFKRSFSTWETTATVLLSDIVCRDRFATTD